MVFAATKQILRNSLNRAGWDLHRWNPLQSEMFRLVRQLTLHRVNIVLDVGANIGQFAKKLREAGFLGRIVSFEASSSAHLILKKNAARDTNWTIAPQIALGDHNGTVVFNLAANSASSSALPMLPSHVIADPKSRYIGSETVPMRMLDNVLDEFLSSGDRVFLKMDVQGSEHAVLQGAKRTLETIIGIQCELSLVPLYEGEHLFHAMLHEMENRHFELWSLVPGLINGDDGRLLQLDAIFFKTGSRPF